MAKKTVRITILLTPAEKRKLEAVAAASRSSVSAYVVRALMPVVEGAAKSPKH